MISKEESTSVLALVSQEVDLYRRLLKLQRQRLQLLSEQSATLSRPDHPRDPQSESLSFDSSGLIAEIKLTERRLREALGGLSLRECIRKAGEPHRSRLESVKTEFARLIQEIKWTNLRIFRLIRSSLETAGELLPEAASRESYGSNGRPQSASQSGLARNLRF